MATGRRLDQPPDGSEESAGQPLNLVDGFDLFYDREYRRVVGLAYVLTGSSSMAEDLAQDTMIEVHRRWSQISEYDDPAGWARRVMINKQRSLVRRLTSEAKALSRIGGRAQPALNLDPSSDHLFSLVRQLPRRQAQAVALRYWDDYTIDQTAKAMDCGAETVKTHLKRGMARLESLLAADGGRAVEPAGKSKPRRRRS
ncbi:MAG: sigma-70 family RNA polymerase sigma factor [Acidimicrobiales bacterium]